MATGKYDSYYDRLQSTGMNMPTREEFNAYMDTDEGRRGLHSRLIKHGYLDKGTSFEEWGENLPMTTAQEADRREYRKKVDLMAGFEREPVKLSPYVQDEPKLETPMVDMSHYWQDEQKRLQSEDDARQTKAEKEWQEKMSDPAFREQIADELQETFDRKKAEWDYNVGKLNRETNRMVDKTKRENNGRLFGGPKAQTSLYEDKSAIPQQEGYLFMGGKKTPLYYDKSGKEHYDALSTMNANRVYDEVINSDNYWMRHWLERAIEDPEYIGQVRDELINKLQDAEKRRMVAVREYTKDNMFMSALVASLNQENGADPYASGAYGEKVAAITTEIQGLRNQLNELDKAEKKYKAANETKKSDGFWEWNNVVNIGRGMKDTVTDKDFWDMGVGNLQSSSEMAGISKKVQEGKELTDHELNMAMTSMINDSVDQYIKLMGGLPMGYTSGEVTAHAVRFIVEMMANPASGFSKGITRQVVRKLGREGAEAVFARRATAIIGNILEAGTLSNTLQGARTLGDAFDRSAGNFGYGQDGKLMVVNDKGFGQALFEAEASSIIENATELMGGGFVADWVGKGVKYAGKYINKFAQTFGITGLSRLGNINWSRWRAMASDLNERAQFHGPFEEWLEEQWGIMLNAAVLNEGEFADLIDPKKQAEIALGVGLMSGFMSSVKTGSYAAEHININREMRRVERETSEHFTPENWALITDGFRNGTDAEIANHLASYLDPRTGLSPEQRSAILNYARTVMRYRGFNRLNESRNDETATEETTPTSQSQTAERPDIIQTSEVEGYETTDEQTITDTRMRADNNRTTLASQLGVEESQVDNALRQMLGDEVTEENIDANLPSDVAQMAKEYLSDSAKTQGVVKRSQDDARELIERTNAEIDRMVNTDTGTIDVATYNGEQVTITSGRVALFEDGLIDRSNSSQSVIIQHQDGTTEMVVPSALENITSQSVDQYKSEAEQRIKSEAEQSLRNKLRGELDYTQGRQYTMLNDNGTQTQVDIIQDNGNGTLTVTARDGKIEGGFTDGKQTTISKDALWQGVDRQRRAEMRQSQEQAAMPTESDVVSTGNVTYDQMSAEDAFATLMEQTENDIDMVVDIAEEEVGERMQIVEEAENAKPEVGTSIEEKIANRRALREARAKAKADLEKWQGIRAFAENYRRASLQDSQENSNFVEQQNNNNNVLQEGRIDPRADRLVSSEESRSRESEERDGSSRSERQYSRPMEMDGESKNSTPSMGVHRDSQLDRRGRLLVEGNTREERVKNAIAKGAPTKFSKVYGVTHTLHDVTPEGVCIYINENGEVSCYLACTDETQIKEDAYVGIFKDSKGKWTSKMVNQTGDRELSRSMMVDVIASLPVGAELTEHSSVSADGMRVLANQLKHGWEYTGETYTCELNANDLNSVLGIQGDSEFRSISWAINDIERLRDILEPYMLALGRSREDINILQRGNVPRGKVRLTLPIIVKTANSLTYPSAQEIVAQVATQEQGLTSAQQTEAQHQNTQTETITQAKTESSAERRARREAEARRKGEERARRNREEAQQQVSQQEQTETESQSTAPQEQTSRTPVVEQRKPTTKLADNVEVENTNMVLPKKQLKVINELAKKLGLNVRFVEGLLGNNANAYIQGNEVVIAWTYRDQLINQLVGHEFLHRMRDVAPEAYNNYVNSVKAVIGEQRWKKLVERYTNLYKRVNADITEEQVTEEIVADFTGEMNRDKGVFDNYLSTHQSDKPLLNAIAKAWQAIKEWFKSIGASEYTRNLNKALKQLNNLIEASEQALPGYLEAEQARGQIEAETGAKPRLSISATMIGSGFDAFAEDGKSPILDEHGNVAMRLGDKMFSARNLVSAKDIKGQGDRSPLNMMINDALELGTINQQKADEMYGKVADILNSFLVAGSAQNGGYGKMAENWLWLGETVYRTIATNGDSQYKYSADITRVCKKNEAVIRSISALQKKVGYGITPGQIMDIYYQTYQKGYQVPCPVCYVFSRYMHNGKYATAAINGMRKYGEHLQGGNDPWTAEQWVEEYNRLVDIKNDKKNVNALKNATADVTTTLDKMDKLAEHVDRLGAQLAVAINKGDVEKQEKIRATIQLLDARYRAALNVISQQSLTNWIKMFAIEKRSGETLNEFAEDQSANEKGGYLNPNEWRIREDNQKPTDIKDFEEHALDLRRSAETMGKYPAITRLRKSGGSAAGKAIAFESNNEVGEFISGLNTSDPENATNWYMEAYNNPDNATYRKKAKERFAKSVVYAGQQSLRGGQRMWSWSDYIESLGPDVVMNLLQLELLGGALQTYSKQLEGNNLVARMEGYVNGSLMAHGNGVVEVSEDQIEVKDGKEVLKDAITETIQENTLYDGVKERTRTLAEKESPIYTDKNGKKYVLTFDDVVGIDPHGRVEGGARKKGLFDINRNLNRSGNILVGMNDTHIKTALADPRIFFVIPWHASGQSNHILSQMLNILGVNTRNFTPMDYTNMQSEKDYNKKDVVLPSKVVDLWERIKTQSQAEEWGDGGIDSNAKGQLTDSQKNYRRLRAEIFDGKYDSLSAEDKALIDNDAFLSQVKNKVSKVPSGKMTNDDNNHIYPYEYWDESSTYEKADVNGKRYLEYCRRLGFRPKFSGKWDKGDKWSSDGDFTQDKGYWKLLVDRRMYDVDGNFQGLTPVSVSGYSTELTDPKHNAKEFVTTQVADDQGAVDIANEVYEAESKRTEKGMPQVDYNMDMSAAVAEYNKLPKVKAGERTLIREAQTEAQKSRFSLTNLTAEEQSIVDEAKANGTYLKAPNGKASNLNEKQWIQVRTKAFKDWFGDWENDPKHASKVVDENGEPMVVYHGSYWNPLEEAEGKAVFSKKYSGANTEFNATDEGFANTAHIGHWFNSSADNLSFYDNIIPAFLNIKNPKKLGSLEGLAEELTIRGVDDFMELLDEYEYDGVMLADEEFGGTSYVALQPTQIKSATDNVGTFDASNPDIRYSLASDINAEVSEGESQQMRYSLRTKPEPKKTIKVYKLFNVDENGNPQALFIDAANSLEVGVWYDADSPTIKDLEGLETEWSYLLDNDGNVVDKKPLKRGKGGNFVGLPSKADVNKATQEGQRWMTVSTSKSGEKAYHTVGINGAGGVSTYALRPGWHATNVPSARHIGVGKDGANAKYRGANQRWFEIEISADVDYNEEARERYLKAHPTYSREKAYSDLKGDIPERIPEDGYYNFKTNSNANPNQDWYIAGAIKIVRPLTEEEGRKISRSKGIAEDLPYKDGVKNFDDSEVRYSLQGGRSIADKYEKKVNTKGVGGAMHLSKFNFMEAWQDEMRALKEVQRIIEQEYGIVLESYEDAYMAENAMSSIAKASWDRYISEVYEPMMRIHDEWIRSGESNESINHYLIAKSGLERNREFMVRDAFRAERASKEESIRDAYRSAIKDLNEKYKPMELDLFNQYQSGAIDKDTYRNERKNLSDAKKAERKPIDDKFQLDMQDAHNKMTQVEEEYKAKRNALRDDLKAGNIDFAEFCRLSDDLALQYSGAEEIADYSGLTALAKMYGSKDWQGFAEQMVRDFEAKHSNTDVMWEHINNNTKSAVDYSYKSGVTSKQAKDHLDQMFLWYVPMKGNADVEAEDIYTYVNDKSSSFTPTVKGAKGHSEYVSEDVMALIANTMQSAILQGERNKVKQKFLNMVENYPTDLFSVDNGWVELQGNDWVEVFPDINENDTPEEVRSKIEDFQEKMQELANEGKAKRKSEALSLGVPFRATQNKSEHAISVMRNGEKMTIYVNGNPRVAQAVNGKLKATPAWGLYETWKRWFSASKTSYSPNFIVSNASRDTGHTAMMTFVQRGLKEQLKALGTYIPAYATLVANAVGKKSPNGYKYDQYLKEFVSNGGVTGYSQLYGVDKFKTDNAKRIARLKGAAKALQQGVNVVENINEIWQNINGIFENSSRFNEYIRSRNRGEDVATSVFNAKNITVNFNKKGGGAVEDSMFHQLAFVGRNWIPFFNPIVQGIYQFLKVGKEHKGRMALACLGFMGGGFLAPILNAMLVGALGGDDEDDYMKQPEWTRRNNFMIYTGDGYAKFALPQMFRELYGIGDILYCAIKGNMSAEDATMASINQVRSIFSLEGQANIKGDWNLLRFAIPDYFGAAVDIETNTNFTGAPLWKETDYNQHDPDYKKAYNNTWSWLVAFSQKVNEWTGGDEYSKGNVNNKYLTNPAVWQRLITEMGGGLTETIGDVYSTAYSLLTGRDIDKSNIPLVKRLYTQTNAETLQKWIDREYYSLEDTHKYVKNRMSKLKKSSALDTADKISMMYYDRDYMVYAIYETYSKEIKELRDQAQSAPEDKKAEIQKREYDAKMKVISLIDNFNAIEDKEVEAYMANNPMVARLVGKDIIKKVGAKYKELKRNWKEAPYMSSEEKKASAALTAFEKTPEYQYYDSIRMAFDSIGKKEEVIDTVLLPKNRLKIKAEIDSIKTQLVELRKAYESIGEVKE